MSKLSGALRRLRGGSAPSTPAGSRPAAEAWKDAQDGEVTFWRKYFETKGEKFPGSYETRFDHDLPLQPAIAELIAVPEGGTARLLDVGAGPLTFLGRKDPRWTLELTAVDALGAEYTALIEEFGLNPPVPVIACETERLSEKLPAGSFDLVTARNTLDHSYDPVAAIRQMLACAKPGAALLLIHRRDEGVREGYRGLHQWNFQYEGGTLIVWRPDTRTDVGEALAGAATVERCWQDGPWEHVVIRKAAAPA